MANQSRNQPCPCGSGRKFKRCCGIAGASNSRSRAASQSDTQQLLQVALNHQRAGHFQQAEQLYLQVLQQAPRNANALNLLGLLYLQTYRYTKALPLAERVVALNPKVPEFAFNLGNVYLRMTRWKDAQVCFENAMRLRAQYPEAANHLGVVYKEQGALDRAIEFYKKALAWMPDYQDALNNLGHALQAQGNTEDAIACYRRVLNKKPDAVETFQNLLLTSNYSSTLDRKAIFDLHKEFADRFERPLIRAAQSLDNSRIPDRRLRIAYLSPDFRSHVVAQFIEPVLQHHDRDNFELFAYYNHTLQDPTTKRLRLYFDQWQVIVALNDEQVAEKIRSDQIDILVDLAGHTSGNRILLFAKRPAPIQVSWIGYPNTTGLSSIDYRITDAYCDPEGEADIYHSEKLLRLPECFSCFTMRDDCPDVAPLPADVNDFITFGSFNNLAKLTPVVLEVWAEILQQVPSSRLVLKYRGLEDAAIRSSLSGLFEKNGIAAERIDCLGQDTSYIDHLQHYSVVDIGLNPFPYNGTTTTCDALWMGVPVITMAGDSHASRVGVSQLSNLGLPELIAASKTDYISIARRLAGNRKLLSSMRRDLRQRMSDSPLLNAAAFTINLEFAYREIWRNWCCQRSIRN